MMTNQTLRRAIIAALMPATLSLASCTTWQRVGDPDSPDPQQTMMQMFNPADLYVRLGRLVSTQGVPFVASVAHLPGPPDSTITIVGVSLSNRAFGFEPQGQGYRARYRVEYLLRRPGEQPISVSRDAQIVVSTQDEAMRTDESILLQQEMRVSEGSYQLTVTVTDLGSRSTGVVNGTVEVPGYQPGSVTAPVLVYNATGRAARTDSVQLLLNTRGALSYGGDTVLVYLEGVGFEGPASVPLEVRDEGDAVVMRRDVSFSGEREIESQLVRVVPDSAPLGALRITVGSGIDARSTSAIVSFSGNWMVTNFDDLLDLLRYFGEDERLDRMSDITDPAARAELWREFYQATDPNKQTPENEALDSYFGRLSVANRNFDNEGMPGWRTDRAEVFVSLGQPDEITDASGQQQGRFIRWVYYEERLSVNFQDVSGFGRFRLTPESRNAFERVKGRLQAGR